MNSQNLKLKLQDLHKLSYMWSLRCTYGNRDLAQDVLQQVYLKILEKDAVYNGKSSFKSWLFSVIKFTAVDMYRKENARERLKNKNADFRNLEEDDLDIKQNKISTGLEADQKHELLSKLQDNLSQRQREVIDLVFYHNMTLENAANVMDLSVGSVRTHYARAKKRLKSAIETLNLKDDLIN